MSLYVLALEKFRNLGLEFSSVNCLSRLHWSRIRGSFNDYRASVFPWYWYHEFMANRVKGVLVDLYVWPLLWFRSGLSAALDEHRDYEINIFFSFLKNKNAIKSNELTSTVHAHAIFYNTSLHNTIVLFASCFVTRNMGHIRKYRKVFSNLEINENIPINRRYDVDKILFINIITFPLHYKVHKWNYLW